MTSMTSLENLYLKIGTHTTGTLSGDGVESDFVNADPLLGFREELWREVRKHAISALYSAGQLSASEVSLLILRTEASIYMEQQFFGGKLIETVEVMRGEITEGKLSLVEKLTYTNCIITAVCSNAWPSLIVGSTERDMQQLNAIEIKFRFEKRRRESIVYGQDGKRKGSYPSEVDFRVGQLGAKAAEPAPAAKPAEPAAAAV